MKCFNSTIVNDLCLELCWDFLRINVDVMLEFICVYSSGTFSAFLKTLKTLRYSDNSLNNSKLMDN